MRTIKHKQSKNTQKENFIATNKNVIIIETRFIFDIQLFDGTFLDNLEQQDGSYLIKTAEELQGLAAYVNEGNNCANLIFKLAPENDILDLSSLSNFTPIGTDSNSFNGTFDGDGKIISGLTITGNNDNVGLFGYLNGGTIQNVKLINASVSGNENVGGIVGTNSGGTIENCMVIGSVSGTSNIGGVVGNGSAGENCYYYKNDNNTYTNTNDGTQIYKLTLPAGVTVTSGAVTIGDETYYTENITFTYSGEYLKVGETLLEKDENNIYSLTLTNDTTVEIATFLDTLDKDGTTYLIKTAADLQGLAAYVNAGNSCANLTFKLAPENNVLDMSGVTNFTPIGYFNNINDCQTFKGTFDGDNKTINNLKINDTGRTYVGLFGYVDNGTVKNVNLTNVEISGNRFVGGVTGNLNGSSTKGTISGCTVSGKISGSQNVGGISGGQYSGKVNGNTVVAEVSGGSNGGVVGSNVNGEISGNKYYKSNENFNVCGNDNYGTYNNNTVLCKLILPEGVTVTSDKITIGDAIYYASPVTLECNSDYLKVGDTFIEKGEDGKFSLTLTGDATVKTATFLDTLDGSGDYNDPYLIKTAADLKGLANFVNKYNTCANYNFKLAPVDKDGNSIDTLDLSSIDNWTPIGTSDRPFAGTSFDGDNKTVSGLKITNGGDNVGLFGYNGGGVIKNINLTNVNINGTNNVGGVVGYNDGGPIENCKVSGTINGNENVGGIVGENYLGRVIGNTNVSSVSGTSKVGSIVGENGENQYSHYSGAVSDNYYYKNSDAISDVGSGTGGNNTQIYKITLPDGVSCTAGSIYDDGEGNIYVNENTEITLFSEVGDLKINGIELAKGSENYTYTYTMTTDDVIIAPVEFIERLEKDTDGSYLIKDIYELKGLAIYVNTGNDCANLTFKLADTLDLSSISNFTPIGTDSNQFKGTFDGDDKTISNLKITGTNDNVGLFGYIDNGTVQNVKLTDVNISGNNKVGGVVGHNGGTVDNCKVSGEIKGENSVGGIVGNNSGGTIKNCNNFASITATATSDVNVGGVVGKGSAGENCYYYKNDTATYTNTEGTQLYKLTLPDGVTASGEGIITFNGGVYAVKGSAVTFNFDESKFYTANIKIDDNNITEAYTVNDDVTVTVKGLEYESTTILIKDAADLQMLSDYVGNGHNCAGKTFKLTKNIDLTDENFTPIGVADYNNANSNFAGTFDGNNKTVSGLNIAMNENCVGLFRANYGTIKNIKVSGKVGGNKNVGGVVGYNGGTINNCTFSGEISGKNNLGGVVGYSNGNGIITVNSSAANANSLKVTVENNSVKSITGLATGDSITYEGKTYKHWIDLSSGVTATDNKLVINNKNYYANGSTVKISGFASGEINFYSAINSLEKSGDNIIAKFSDNDKFTISGLTFPSDSNSWKVSGTAANYAKRYTAGAVISGNKIFYQIPADEIFVTVSGLNTGVSLNNSNTIVDVANKKITIKDANLLSNGASLSADNGYSVELATSLAPKNSVSQGWNENSYYTAAGYKTAGWIFTNGKVNRVNAATAAVTVSGLNNGVSLNDSNITVDIANKKITIKDASLLSNGASLSADNGYSVELATSLAPKNSVSQGWNENSYYTAAGYKTAGWIFTNGKVNRVNAATAAVTVSGLNTGVSLNDSNISVDIANKKITIKDASLLSNGASLSADNGYSVELAASLAPKNSVSQGWNGNSYYTAAGYKTAGWTISNGKVNQINAATATVTVSGLKRGMSIKNSNITVDVSKKKVTITDVSLLSNGASLSADNGYSVELATSLAPKNSVSEGWNGNNYNTKTNWTLNNGNKVNSITPVVKISGLNSNVTLDEANITVDVVNKKVTIKDAGLLTDGASVSVDNGYKVELAASLAPKNSVSQGWNGNSYYTAAGYKTAGWTISNGKVNQINAATATVTVSGLKRGMSIKNSNITVDVSKKKVTITDVSLLSNGASLSADNGYSVELAASLAPKTTAASWSSLYSGKATYTCASNTAGYTLDNNKVSYISETPKKTFTISGIKSTSGIKVNGNTVTLNAAALKKETVTISKGYTLQLGSDVNLAVESSATLKKGKYTTAGVKTAGYKLADNKVSYLTEEDVKTIRINGLASGAKASDIKVDGQTITLGKNAISENGKAISVETRGYTLSLNGLSEVILCNNGKATKANYYYSTTGKTPKGYKKVIGSDKKTYYIQEGANFNHAYKNYGIKFRIVEGKSTTYMAEVPSGYKKVIDSKGSFYTKTITMSATLKNVEASKKNLVLTAGKEKITVTGAANKTVKVTANGIVYKAAAGIITNTKTDTVTIMSSYDASKGYTATKNITVINAKKVKANIVLDGSKATAISIMGGSGNDKLIGGAGNDSLYGGSGNDTLTGGKGNDVFICSGGNNTITDYAKGDKISIGAAIIESSVKGTDATFKTDAGTLTVKNGKGKKLVVIEENGETETIIGGAYLVTDNSKAVKIVGNSLDNTIIGGSSNDSLYGKNGDDYIDGGNGNDKLFGGADNDTLWGGAGNDTLIGGDGNDTFIYQPNNGNDVISDYKSGDMLTILDDDGNSCGSFTKSIFSGNELKLIINGGGTILFEGVTKNAQFNINGTIYKISGSKLK